MHGRTACASASTACADCSTDATSIRAATIAAMPVLRAIPRNQQRDEPWANGAGSTTVVLREPDGANWRVRISVARVDQEGPFSELPGTRRTLVPLDRSMTLRFADGHELSAQRLTAMHFEGSPAPTGMLPEGPTRDFNLMLRGDARGDVLPHKLADSLALSCTPGLRWLVYLDNGHIAIHAGAKSSLVLNPGDAALLVAGDAAAAARIEGTGEIILVKLYA